MIRPLVDIIIPVYNGQNALAHNIGKLDCFLEAHCPHLHEIVITDNGSTDSTLEVALGLQAGHDSVRVMHLAHKGRGGALRTAWNGSRADILSYMDVDLSTDLSAFPALVGSLANGDYDLAVGSRLLKPNLTHRCFKREALSRGYNLLVKAVFQTEFSDAQCGFKAITQAAARELLPLVEDTAWFFDTELLVIAEKLGYRIFDLPVRWTENPDSRVKIWRTAFDDIKGLIRLRRNFARGKYRRPAPRMNPASKPEAFKTA